MVSAWLTWLGLVWGSVYLVTDSVIFDPLRVLLSRWGRAYAMVLLHCPACTGFWVGLALGGLGFWPVEGGFLSPLYSAIVACAAGALWGRLVPPTSFERTAPELGLVSDEAEESEDGEE